MSQNSKRVIQKTNFNMKIETLTVQVDIIQPLDSCICQSWLLMNYSKCQNFSSRTFWDPELRLLINYDVIPTLVLN